MIVSIDVWILLSWLDFIYIFIHPTSWKLSIRYVIRWWWSLWSIYLLIIVWKDFCHNINFCTFLHKSEPRDFLFLITLRWRDFWNLLKFHGITKLGRNFAKFLFETSNVVDHFGHDCSRRFILGDLNVSALRWTNLYLSPTNRCIEWRFKNIRGLPICVRSV